MTIISLTMDTTYLDYETDADSWYDGKSMIDIAADGDMISQPSDKADLSGDVNFLRNFLRRRLQIDYDPRYRKGAYRLDSSYQHGTFGRYLEDSLEVEKHTSSGNDMHSLLYSRKDGNWWTTEERFPFTHSYMATLAEEAGIEKSYVAEQVDIYIESNGTYECLTHKLAARGKWQDLAEKITSDLEYTMSSHGGWLIVPDILRLSNLYFEKGLEGRGKYKLTRKALDMDLKRTKSQSEVKDEQDRTSTFVGRVSSRIRHEIIQQARLKARGVRRYLGQKRPKSAFETMRLEDHRPYVCSCCR